MPSRKRRARRVDCQLRCGHPLEFAAKRAKGSPLGAHNEEPLAHLRAVCVCVRVRSRMWGVSAAWVPLRQRVPRGVGGGGGGGRAGGG
eukprot:scaffold19011_cov32-Tisochrysis_lutea.AAC.5